AHLVGGDYFGYLPLARPDAPPGTAPRWAVVLADVMGKGMPAALLMARLSAEVRVLLLTEPDPARAVERLNQELYDAELGERFITFLLVLLDGQDHRLTIVNAGHWAPLIRRAGGRVEVIGQEQSGMSLAVFDDQSYQAVATGIEPGDVVLLYTDGVNEAMNPRNEPFGSRRLHQALLAAPGPVPAVGQAVLRAVQAHTAGQDQSDDITLVCFGRER
ncbi:MAG TPA: PP2C family protein-serine/threonine phosphatase, partial [Isosphaeraceae bacterium]